MNKSKLGFLVTAEQLRDTLNSGHTNLRIFDCTVSMFPSESGYRIESVLSTVVEQRIPGAYFLDLRDGLHDATNDQGFARAQDAQLQRVLRASGISEETQVVLYSTTHPMWATRVWWQLYTAGLTHVSILDGGLRSWLSIDGDVERGALSRPYAGNISVSTDPKRWADIEEVAKTMSSSSVTSVCALPEGSYAGTSDEHYGRPGHIPSSVSVPYDDILEGGTFKAPDTLHQEFGKRGLTQDQRIICYCGGGIAATVDAFALALLGYTDVAVYDGSMHEWSRDASRPVVTGVDP